MRSKNKSGNISVREFEVCIYEFLKLSTGEGLQS